MQKMKWVCIAVMSTLWAVSASAQPAPPLPQLVLRDQDKPVHLVAPDGIWTGERTIYHDPVTGVEVWKVTHDPAINRRNYYDMHLWNADGSQMMIWSYRTGSHELYLMNADGTGIRRIVIPGLENNPPQTNWAHWSYNDPKLFYFTVTRGNTTAVQTYNWETGDVSDVAVYNEPGFRLYPLHPQEDIFLLAHGNDVGLVSRDGSVNRRVTISREHYHRLRFTKGKDHSLFWNTDDPPMCSYFSSFDGTVTMPLRGHKPEELGRRGSHPDFSYSGEYFSFVEDGFVEMRNRRGETVAKLARINGGWGAFTWGDAFMAWGVPAGYCHRPEWRDDLGGVILMVSVTEPTKVWTVAGLYSSHVGYAGGGHPDVASTQPYNNASWDVTKIGWQSDAEGRYSDIYVGVVRYPMPPRMLIARRSGGGVQLQWQPPETAREIAGYHVYRSARSGRDFVRLNRDLVTTQEFTDTSAGDVVRYYRVVAQEYSGLQGRSSNEVCAAPVGEWAGPSVVFAEIELGTRGPNVIDDLDGRYSNNFHVRLNDVTGEGTVEVPVEVPKDGAYRLYTRAASEAGRPWYYAAVDGGGEVLVRYEDARAAGGGFYWTSSRETFRLKKGAHRILYRISHGPVRLDCLALTDDPDFVPDAQGRWDAAPPAPVQSGSAESVTPAAIRVHWMPSPDPDVRYYNVYGSPDRDFSCDRNTLILSPADTSVIDWGLQPEGPQYRPRDWFYRVTAVDYCGNESAPSPLITGRMQAP